MRKKRIFSISSLLLLITVIFFPGLVKASTLTVSKSCGTTPDCFGTITSAISEASSSTAVDTIVIQQGTYNESITLTKTITLKGVETARTVIQSGASTAISVNTLANVIIEKLTITSTSVGIQAANVTNLEILNNIFWGGGSGTAIQITGTFTGGKITNNTFFNNNTAINSAVDVPIKDNIFSNNITALAGITFTTINVQYNLFKDNGSIGSFTISQTDPTEKNIPSTASGRTNDDPKFVDSEGSPPDFDLHLQAGSGAIGTSSTGGDIGAFGGAADADNIPFPVSDLVVSSVTGTPPATAILNWSPNKSYRVGGYFVYVGTAPGTYGTPIDTLSTTPTYTLSGLVSTVASGPTGSPQVGHTIENSTINLSWSPVTGATGYEIRYDTTAGIITPPTAPAASTVTIDAGNVTSQPLTNLENGTTYYFIVTPFAQTIYYIAVKPYYSSDKSLVSSIFSNEVQARLNDKIYGASSDEQHDFPEATVGFPDLPNKGCFIATAAYGYYSAPQVQILRTFRDRCLMTNKLGKAFVEWYYRYGPVGAEYMNAHPWLKPAVRIVLLPLIGAAWIVTETTLSVKMVIFFVLGTIPFFLIARRRLLKNGR